MKIFLIGSGNVASQLGNAFKNCGHEIVFVCSPNISHARALGRKLKTKWGKSLDAVSEFPLDVYLIAVKDDAIADVVKRMPPVKNALVIHTSGATDISILKRKFKNCGVLWQIQTIKSRTRIDFKKVSLVIEANNSSAGKKLKLLARSLSNQVYAFNSRERRVLHLAAVWSNNFVNHLYYLAETVLKKHNLPYDLFGPLILSTAENGIRNPKGAQTGPAKRNDEKTMKEHLKILPKTKYYRKLYALISRSIRESG